MKLVEQNLQSKANTHNVILCKNYYHDEFVEQEEAEQLIKKSNNINLVGNNAISLSLNLGIGSKQSVKLIDNIPFLIIIKM